MRLTWDEGIPDPGEFTDRVAGAFRDYRDFREGQKRSDREFAEGQKRADQYKRQNDLSAARAERAQKQADRMERRQAAQDRQKLAENIVEGVRKGGTTEANAVAKVGRYIDPITGEERGLDFDMGEEPEMQFDKLRLKEPEMDPGMAAGQGLRSMFGFDLKGEGPPGTDVQERVDSAREQYRQAPRRNPAILMGDDRIDIDPNEINRYQREKDSGRADELLAIANDPRLPPDVREAAALRAGLTRAQATGAEGAQVMGVESREDSQRFKSGESALDRKARLDAAALRRKGSGKPKGPTKAQEIDDIRATGGQAETVFKNYLDSQGYKGAVTAHQNYANMLEDMKSSNLAQVQGGIGAWVKEKSGGSAVVTDNELARYAPVPWDERVKLAAKKWLAGEEAPPEYAKMFRDALEKSVLARQKDIIKRMGAGARATFANHPNPALREYADHMYQRAVSPLMTAEEIESAPPPRKAGAAGAPAPGNDRARIDALKAKLRARLGGGQ